MNDDKRIKDPIYGYIIVPSIYINNIIDTAVFQRLRRIIQTSYAPLYSSAMHNRFVHSMGVYHLGRMAFHQIKKNKIGLSLVNEEEFEKLGVVFELACLLHDVGHAPFSHTGEIFYLDENEKYDKLHGMLRNAVNKKDFSIPSNKSRAAAPHEIMSAIIGLEEFAKYLPENSEDEREFFARCITGYMYKDSTRESKLKNCFISLLNSKIIDVDKLDYLIRDAYITGFDTVKIDYVRLLTSLTIVHNKEEYYVAYNKSALSVIENVIYAHDAERKWIQTHPVVIYEGYLVYHMIRYINEKMNSSDRKLFSRESLSTNGQEFSNGTRIRLMSDDDIIYLAKNVYRSDLGDEYYERVSRRHPVWKSEAEYKVAFLEKIGSGEVLDKFEKTMEKIGEYLKRNSDNGIINNELLKKIEGDQSTKLDFSAISEKIGNLIINKRNEEKENMLKVLLKLKEYAECKGIEFSFVILTASQFTSSFGKPDFENIDVVFDISGDAVGKIEKFFTVASSLMAKERQREKFFYLFYKRDINNPVEINSDEISRILFSAIM